MKNSIKLKRFLNSIEIQIQNDSIMVIKKSPTEYHEFNIEYEQISIKKIIKREMNQSVLFFLFGFSIISIIKILILLVDSTGGLGTSIFLFITLILVILTFTSWKRSIIIPNTYGENSLILPFNDSNEKEVREFADLIIKKTKDFLIAKYAQVDKDLPRDSQFEKIMSLKDRDIISEEEFNKLKNILLDKDKDKKIGF
jgi:hypothetical protein